MAASAECYWTLVVGCLGLGLWMGGSKQQKQQQAAAESSTSRTPRPPQTARLTDSTSTATLRCSSAMGAAPPPCTLARCGVLVACHWLAHCIMERLACFTRRPVGQWVGKGRGDEGWVMGGDIGGGAQPVFAANEHVP